MTYLEKYAIITGEICKNTTPGKKMIQKLLYLIERTGVDLDLNYSILFFGPYSAKLDNALHTLENYGQIEIDTSAMTHIIKTGNRPIDGQLEDIEQEKVNYVLEHFLGKTALELEAITTLDYAATRILNNNSSDEDIVNQVMSIKGSKFKKDYLRNCLKTLRETRILS